MASKPIWDVAETNDTNDHKGSKETRPGAAAGWRRFGAGSLSSKAQSASMDLKEKPSEVNNSFTQFGFFGLSHTSEA